MHANLDKVESTNMERREFLNMGDEKSARKLILENIAEVGSDIDWEETQ
jgi:hemerythrin superfamily protein